MNSEQKIMFEAELQNYENKRINNELNAIELTVALEQAKINDALDSAIEIYNICEQYLTESLTAEEENELTKLQEKNKTSTLTPEEKTRLIQLIKNRDYSEVDKKIDKLNNMIKDIAKSNSITSYTPASDLVGDKDTIYEPVKLKKITEIQDLSFPENIKFLITQIIDWVKRVIKYLINKILVLFNRVIGNQDRLDELNADAKHGRYSSLKDLKPEFTKAIKNINTGVLKPITGYNAEKEKNAPLKLFTVNTDDLMGPNKLSFLSPLSESAFEMLEGKEILTEKDDNPKPQEVKVVQLDTSADLYALQQTVTHFFKLFDESFGSNGEYLFDASDLELIFKTISNIFKALKSGNVNPIALNNVNEIRSDKVYSGLIRTKANVDNLEKAYYATYTQIDKIMKIITSKQLYSLTQFGVQYACLSKYTYEALNSLIETVSKKYKDAEKLEKNLKEMNDKFDKLTTELEKYRTALYGYGTITVKSIYQEKMNDLYTSTKYLTQITTLRLTVLSKYIRELQDIKNIILSLSNIVRAGQVKVEYDDATEPATAVKQKRGLFSFLK